MRPASAQFREHIRESHTIKVRAAVLSTGSDPVDIPITAGAVTLDAKAASRGRMDVSLVDDGTLGLVPTDAGSLLAPYGNELQIWRGLILPDGEAELISLGVFRIDVTGVDETPGGRLIQMNGLDRSGALIDARFEAPYYVVAGTPVETAIVNTLAPVMPGLKVAFPGAPFVTPLLIAEEGGDRWKFCQDIATACGLLLYFDGDGYLRLQPPLGGYPVATFAEGADGLLISAKRDWRREGSYNIAVVTGENTGTDTPARGIAQDLNPLSPTYVHGSFGRVPVFLDSQLVVTTAQAQAAADALLIRQLGTTQTVQFGTIVDPSLEPGDVARITRLAAGIDEDHTIDSLTIPLDVDTELSATTRALIINEAPTPAPDQIDAGVSRMREVGATDRARSLAAAIAVSDQSAADQALEDWANLAAWALDVPAAQQVPSAPTSYPFNGQVIDPAAWSVSATGVTQNDKIILSNANATWLQGLASKASFSRSQNMVMEADVKSVANGYMMIGWTNAAANPGTPYYYPDAPHYLYFMLNDAITIRENGGLAASPVQAWAVGTTYRVRIVLKAAGGAAYYWSTDGGVTWVLLWAGDTDPVTTPVNVGVNFYSGQWEIDNVKVSSSPPAGRAYSNVKGYESGMNRGFAVSYADDLRVSMAVQTIAGGAAGSQVIVGMSDDPVGEGPASLGSHARGLLFDTVTGNIVKWDRGALPATVVVLAGALVGTQTWSVTITADGSALYVNAYDVASGKVATAIFPRYGFALNNLYVYNADTRALAGSSIGPISARKALATVTPAARVTEPTVEFGVTDEGRSLVEAVFPAGYDSRVGAPVVLLHHGAGGTVNSTDQIQLVRDLVAAGYVTVASYYMPAPVNWGNQNGVRASLLAYWWFRDRYPVGPVILAGISMGSITSLVALSERDIPGVVGWVGIFPAADLDVFYYNPTYTDGINRAYGVSSAAAYELATQLRDPMDLDPRLFRGVPMLFLATTDDPVVVRASHAIPLHARVDPWCDATILDGVGGHGPVDTSGQWSASLVAWANTVTTP